MRRVFAAASVAVIAALAAVGGAGATRPAAAGPQTDTFSCNGTPVTVRIAPAVGTQDKENVTVWGAGQVVSGATGHLIPVAFSFSAVDTQNGVTLFANTDTKGNGNASQAQSTIECTQSEPAGTVADLLQGDQLPDYLAAQGVQLTDPVTLTFTVTAVPKA
jgi:hypothetical protein